MKNDKVNWPAVSYVAAFLIGVIMFWSIGNNWLNFESILVFLAWSIGVAVSVLVFGVWNVIHYSNHKEK